MSTPVSLDLYRTVRMLRTAVSTATRLKLATPQVLQQLDERIRNVEALLADAKRKGGGVDAATLESNLQQLRQQFDAILNNAGMRIEGASWAALAEQAKLAHGDGDSAQAWPWPGVEGYCPLCGDPVASPPGVVRSGGQLAAVQKHMDDVHQEEMAQRRKNPADEIAFPKTAAQQFVGGYVFIDEGGTYDFDHAVHELVEMFIPNDQQAYNHLQACNRNLAAKKARGVYDSQLAIKLMMYCADRSAKAYVQQVGDKHDAWNKVFPKQVRQKAAQDLVHEFEQQYEQGEFDATLPKKYQRSAAPAAPPATPGAVSASRQQRIAAVDESQFGPIWKEFLAWAADREPNFRPATVRVFLQYNHPEVDWDAFYEWMQNHGSDPEFHSVEAGARPGVGLHRPMRRRAAADEAAPPAEQSAAPQHQGDAGDVAIVASTLWEDAVVTASNYLAEDTSEKFDDPGETPAEAEQLAHKVISALEEANGGRSLREIYDEAEQAGSTDIGNYEHFLSVATLGYLGHGIQVGDFGIDFNNPQGNQDADDNLFTQAEEYVWSSAFGDDWEKTYNEVKGYGAEEDGSASGGAEPAAAGEGGGEGEMTDDEMRRAILDEVGDGDDAEKEALRRVVAEGGGEPPEASPPSGGEGSGAAPASAPAGDLNAQGAALAAEVEQYSGEDGYDKIAAFVDQMKQDATAVDEFDFDAVQNFVWDFEDGQDLADRLGAWAGSKPRVVLDNESSGRDTGDVTVTTNDRLQAQKDQYINGSTWETPSDMREAYTILLYEADLDEQLRGEGYEVDSSRFDDTLAYDTDPDSGEARLRDGAAVPPAAGSGDSNESGQE